MGHALRSTTGGELDIAPGLTLPADYVAGGSLAILGKRGSGKTFASRVLSEELFAAQVHLVILDPMGVFWGLRSGADGVSDGLPIPIFGGQHADAPLEPDAGTLMADLVVEERLSMILDISGFSSRTQERNFASAFFDRLYRRNHDLVHVIVDEADMFAPQRPRGQDAPLLATMENLVRRGRNRGIGVTMTSQRAATLNKDVLSQVDALVAMRVTAPQDRDAIREWVRGQGDEQLWATIAPSLPQLANGESWWWIPEKSILKRVTVRRTETFNSSPTRKRGQARRSAKTFADVDLAAISERISASIERAKQTDPTQLRKRITQLEADLAAARAATSAPPDRQEQLVGRLHDAGRQITHTAQTVLDAQTTFDEQLRTLLAEHTTAIRRATEDALDAARAIANTAAEPTTTPASPGRPSRTGRPRTSVPRGVPALPPPSPSPAAAVPMPTADGDAHGLTPARQRLLNSLATLESIGVMQVGKTQLALWAGVSPKSSGYANNLGGMRSAGLISYPGPALVALTDEGRAAADPSRAPALITDEDLHRHVQQLVTPARWRIIEPLLDAYPDAIAKNDLAEHAGVSARSSGYANNLGALKSLGLIDYRHPGTVAAASTMFLHRAE